MKALSLELKELEQKLEWIRTFGEDEKKFNLLNKAIVESEKTLIESKSKKEKIGAQILLLVEKKSDLENLIKSKTNDIGDIEERLPKILIPKDEWHPADIGVNENTQNYQTEWRMILGLERQAKIRQKQSKLFDDADYIHTITEGQFRDSDLKSVYNKIISKLDSLHAKKAERTQSLWKRTLKEKSRFLG